MTNFNQQIDKIRKQPGFIAALDQSGGSTPKAIQKSNLAMESNRDFKIESRFFCLSMPQWTSIFIWPLTIMFVAGVIGAVVITVN